PRPAWLLKSLPTRRSSDLGAAVEIECVGADPVFDLIGFGERRSPLNARGIDLFVGLEIDDDPLWMERIRFAGEFASEVGIAFPIDRKSTRLNSSHVSISYA